MTLTVVYAYDDLFAIYVDGKLWGAHSGTLAIHEILEMTVGHHVAACKAYEVRLNLMETFPERLDATFFARLIEI